MTITRFTPFRTSLGDVTTLQNRINSMFHELARPESRETESLASGSFIPAVDIYEDVHQVVLKLEVPGVRQEDIDIRIEDQTLIVKGERKFEASEKEENFHRIERRFGSFVRSFTLPQSVDPEAVKASYENGVLSISIGKKAEAKPRQIKVELGSAAPAPKQVGAAKA